MSTTEVARDMDVMRVLLGDEKLNFFGGSYGTFLGAIYADTFPKKVGRMVLDSAMSPNQTEQQEMTYDIQGFESSIDAFIDWCVARPDCALGSDKAGARQKIVDLLDDVEKNGLTTNKPGPDPDRRGVGRLLDLHVPLLRPVVADAQQGARPGVHRQGRHPPRQGHVGRRARHHRRLRAEHLPAGDDPGAVRGLAALHGRRRPWQPSRRRRRPRTRSGPG